jgi:hypothetical protein
VREFGPTRIEKAFAVGKNECHVPDTMHNAIRYFLHRQLDHKAANVIADEHNPVEISLLDKL